LRALDDDVRHQVPHEETGTADHPAKLLHALVAFVLAHQLAEVDDAVRREERGELVPQAVVDDAAVAGEQLVDGDAIVGGQLGPGDLLLEHGSLPQGETAAQARTAGTRRGARPTAASRPADRRRRGSSPPSWVSAAWRRRGRREPRGRR